MSAVWETWLAERADARERAGLTRRLTPRAADDDAIDLAGNDYLGLSRHPRVVAAAAEASRRWGAGAGASRLVTGTLTLHADLERCLACFTGRSAALALSSGYHANLAAVTALAGRDALVVSDAHVHASLIDAARLSRAEIAIVAHNDVGAVREALRRAGRRRTLVLAESVYSVLGDLAPLGALAAACADADALLLVDEAHGLGVRGMGGRGALHEAGLADAEHVVMTATLSKALGAQGGAVLATPPVIDHLVNSARAFIFDTALAPAPTAAALAALQLIEESPRLTGIPASRAHALAARLGIDPPAGAVLSVSMPTPAVAVAARADALDAGLRIGCFRPPSVPDGISRLRITCGAGSSEDAWSHAVDLLVKIVERHR